MIFIRVCHLNKKLLVNNEITTFFDLVQKRKRKCALIYIFSGNSYDLKVSSFYFLN